MYVMILRVLFIYLFFVYLSFVIIVCFCFCCSSSYLNVEVSDKPVYLFFSNLNKINKIKKNVLEIRERKIIFNRTKC